MADFIWFLRSVTAGIAGRFPAGPGVQGPENRQFRPPHPPGAAPYKPAGKQLANAAARPEQDFASPCPSFRPERRSRVAEKSFRNNAWDQASQVKDFSAPPRMNPGLRSK
ncbi:MAG: hypothetical protein OXM58_07360 [Rhodospirillaceae bacterium]|nr:hypothetical protein [Rhodospirillaceae bacterium]MDE0616201.1 hypothetical protein [Rhodospirillaceae bacterium]